MSHYLRIMLNAAFIMISVGLLLPFLFSAADTLLVAAGFAYLFLVMPAILYYANRTYIKNLMEKF
jgi:hypothetical protein